LLIRSLAANNRVVMLIFADHNGSAFSDANSALASFASRGR